jgi:hypothetical protein
MYIELKDFGPTLKSPKFLLHFGDLDSNGQVWMSQKGETLSKV